jgi:hypothetical protein
MIIIAGHTQIPYPAVTEFGDASPLQKKIDNNQTVMIFFK